MSDKKLIFLPLTQKRHMTSKNINLSHLNRKGSPHLPIYQHHICQIDGAEEGRYKKIERHG